MRLRASRTSIIISSAILIVRHESGIDGRRAQELLAAAALFLFLPGKICVIYTQSTVWFDWMFDAFGWSHTMCEDERSCVVAPLALDIMRMQNVR